MPKSRVIIIGVAGLIVVFFLLLFTGIIPGLRPPSTDKTKVKLNFWGVFDSPEAMNSILEEIPGFEVSYRSLNPETYESDLISALASGRGPDVFMVHSSWLPKHSDKLAPANADQISLESLRSLYPTVVEQDFAPDQFVYGLPLYLDTLVLFYNRDIFDSKGVAEPPKTWADFERLVTKLRELDSSGRIIKAAAAIGGSNKSVNRATDLLSVLMLQSGLPMVSADFERAVFAEDGGQSLSFYTKFANPVSTLYTWNDSLKNSLDNFSEEGVAMIFNYGYQTENLKAKNPFLKFGVAPLPQPQGAAKTVNFANYWGIGVSNRFQNPRAAWNFILSLAADPKIVSRYAESMNRLPALRSLISELTDDPFWGVFGKQALSARSWPQIDSVEVDKIFSNMIEQVITGRSDINRALEEAESAVTRLMRIKRGNLE